MELVPGLHVIDAPFEGTRQINLFLLRGERNLLVDSGVAGVPSATVLPYLHSVGLDASDLALLVNLHAHADHVGGNAELLEASGGTLRIGAHRMDAPAVADHRLLATQIYGLTDADRIATLIKRCGDDVPVEERYAGGETIDLGGGVSLQVLHIPGHTPGNISLYSPTHRALIQGESVMGASQEDDEGYRTAPFGTDPAAYRQGLEALRALDFEWFLSSHRPPMRRTEGLALIDASLTALDEFEATCRAALMVGVTSVDELAHAAAMGGSYRPDPRLVQQVSRLLEVWMQSGTIRRTKAGEYRLN
ncbi:MAG TPA: MBL fold metallo-hydrolase [Chloroflexi bacterium]|jgi:glyoxylase-like metal-dependent hydrolase (beta-lactamase superfamily II)|nr:MBL fold metallo-hydrolase [Chloroflexota bacterium]